MVCVCVGVCVYECGVCVCGVCVGVSVCMCVWCVCECVCGVCVWVVYVMFVCVCVVCMWYVCEFVRVCVSFHRSVGHSHDCGLRK